MVNQDNKHFAGCKSEKGLLESGAPGIGHNSGGAPEALSPDEIVAIEASWRNATLPARIVLAYVQGRAPAFSPGQRGSELSQTAILQNATLRCLVAMARADRQMDLRPVLVALIASFSANKHWRSSVSLARLAKMLDRNERTIRRYLVKLVQERWVVQVDRAGFTTAYTLAFTELDATPGLSLTLILDVLAPKEGGRWGRGHWEPNDSACPGPRITLDTIATEASSITPDNMLSGVGNLAPDTNCDSPGHTGCPQNKDSKNIILEGAPPKFASEDDDCLTKQAHKSRPLRPEQKVQIGQISAWDKANPPAGYIYERGVFASAVSVASEYLGIFRFVDIAEQVNLMLPCGAKIEAADISELVIAKVSRDAENREAGVAAATLDPRYAASNIASDVARSLARAKRHASTAGGFRGKPGSAATSKAWQPPTSPEAIAAATSAKEWESIISLYAKTKKWTGPGQPPGVHGCLAPAHLIDTGAAR